MRAVALAGMTGVLVGAAAITRETRRRRARQAWKRSFERYTSGHRAPVRGVPREPVSLAAYRDLTLAYGRQGDYARAA